MFYTSRLTAIWKPRGGAEVQLVAYGRTRLPEPPEREWVLPTDEREYVDSAWGGSVPTGNRKLRWSVETLWEAPTVAQLEAAMQRHELEMTEARQGELLLLEAWHAHVPAMRTRWVATLTGLTTRRILPEGDALAQPHEADSLMGRANGAVRYEFELRKPREE